MTKYKVFNLFVAIAMVVNGIGICAGLWYLLNRPEVDAMPTVPTQFDTKALDAWDSGEDVGTIRMVGAWVAEHEDNLWLLEDEQGEQWYVEYFDDVKTEDFFLLWIADNNTAQVDDDVIIKTWREAY